MRIAVVQLEVVPNVPTADGTRWLPEHPLEWELAGQSAAVSPKSTLLPSVTRLQKSTADRLAKHRHERLQQVLSELEKCATDFVVIPEYALDCTQDTLKTLQSFASRMTIVAGLGVPRSVGADVLREITSDEVLPNANIVGVFAGEGCWIVSKAHGAKDEGVEPGTGPRVFELTVAGESVRVGVAICKDYLLSGHSLQELGPLDIAAIPAHTPTTTAFYPDAPRDFVRAFANSAGKGGSSVMASGVEGVAADRLGAKPLPSRSEGYIVVDWHSSPTRPTALTAQANRVTRRSGIVSGASDDLVAVASGVNDLASAVGTADRLDPETLTRWLRHVDGDSRSAIIRESVEELLEAYSSDVVTPALLDTLCSHLIIRGSLSLGQLRTEALTYVADNIQALLASPNLSEAAYEQLLGAAKAYSPWNRQLQERTAEAPPGEGVQVEHVAIGLGPFDTEDAQATVASQIDLLHAFAVGAPTNSSFSVRLSTDEDPVTGSPVARCALVFSGPTGTAASNYFGSLERSVRAIFVRAWSLYQPVSSVSDGFQIGVVPSEHSLPRSREDLGALVDVLRASGPGIELNLNAIRAGAQADDPETRVTEADVMVSALLVCPEPNVHLANLIGAMLFPEGWELVHSPSVPFGRHMSVAAAAHVVHPPEGRIDGRGLQHRRDLRLSVEDIGWPVEGAELGAAAVAQPYVDRKVEIRIPEASRLLHTYVVGRTGSGKTNTLKNIVRHDLHRPGPLVVVDPHGELYEYALRHLPEGRLFAPLDFAGSEPLRMNPFLLDADSVQDVERNIEEVIELLSRSSFHQWYGPRFAHLASLAIWSLFAVAEATGDYVPSMGDVPSLFESDSVRGRLVGQLEANSRDDLLSRWRQHSAMRTEERAEVEQWLASRFTEFRTSQTLLDVMSGTPNVSLKSVLSQGGVVLVRIPTTIIGSGASAFLGSLVVSRLMRMTMSGSFVQSTAPASLIVDEFQNFVNSGFATLIPEARKYNLSITLANQTLSQLVRFDEFEGRATMNLRDTLMGNVGNLVVQSVGRADAEILAPELGLSMEDLLRVGKHSAAAVLTVDGRRSLPFTLQLTDAGAYPGAVADSSVPARRAEALAWLAREVRGLERTEYRQVGVRKEDVTWSTSGPVVRPRPERRTAGAWLGGTVGRMAAEGVDAVEPQSTIRGTGGSEE